VERITNSADAHFDASVTNSTDMSFGGICQTVTYEKMAYQPRQEGSNATQERGNPAHRGEAMQLRRGINGCKYAAIHILDGWKGHDI